MQRRYLAAAVAAKFPGFADVEYPDWHAFLARLASEVGRTGASIRNPQHEVRPGFVAY